MAIAESAARKVLRGGGGSAIARGIAEAEGGVGFGLDSLWQLVAGFFAEIFDGLFAALAGVVHLLVLPFEELWRLILAVVTGAAGVVSWGFHGLCQLVTGFFDHLIAALAGAAHILVLPFEELWQLLLAAAGAVSSGFHGLCQLVTGFFAHLISALAGVVHMLVLPFEELWRWLAGAAGAISSDLSGMWQSVSGFFTESFAHIIAAIAGAAHMLVVPFEELWRWLTGAAGAICSDLVSVWQLVTGFITDSFAHFVAALEGAAHQLVQPLEEMWRWFLTAGANAAATISSDLDGLCQFVKDFFSSKFFVHPFAVLAGAAHALVLHLEAFWRWLLTTGAGATGAISSDINSIWLIVKSFFAGVVSPAIAGAAHDSVLHLVVFWRWVQAAAGAALPYALGVIAVLLVVAVLWLCWPVLGSVAPGVCKALVCAATYLGYGLYCVVVAIGTGLGVLLPHCAGCLLCCASVTMKAPGTAGMLISRAAFQASPALYFSILHAAGPVVAAAVFSTRAVAWVVAAPVAALFRVSSVA